jgi:hypothetical protein
MGVLESKGLKSNARRHHNRNVEPELKGLAVPVRLCCAAPLFLP